MGNGLEIINETIWRTRVGETDEIKMQKEAHVGLVCSQRVQRTKEAGRKTITT